MMTKLMAKGYLWLLLVLLYSPILIIMIFSFTEAKVLGNWTGFSTKLYSSLFTGGVQRSLVSALWNTFAIAMIAATVSTYLRVKLDTENYRERRKETLETLAKNIAYKVKRTKRPVSLEPMNPYERRIIHAALQNDKYVTTRSEGEEPFRHVVIALKKEASGGDRKGRYDKNKGGRYDRSSGGYKGNNRRSHYSSTASSGASEETAAGDEE